VLVLFAAPCSAQSDDAAKRLEHSRSGSPQQRYLAIDELGERHESAESVVPVLRELLRDEDAQVRWRSARALGDYGPLAQDTVADVRQLLAEEDPIIRYHAAVALGRIGDRSDETLRALLSAVVGSDSRVARAAIAALRTLKPDPEQFMPIVQKILESDDQAVVVHALEALVDQGGAAAPFLIEALKRTQTAYLACAAIEGIGPEAAATVPALTDLITKTSHSQLQIRALLALASIGPAAQSAAPKIVPLLDSPHDATVPAAAAYALGAIEAPGVDAALRNAVSTGQPFQQMAAAWSLARLHPADEGAVRQAVDKLTQGLGSNDALIRAAAAKGLQMLQAPPELVAPALIAMANDPDPDVSRNVVDALVSLGDTAVPRAIKALQNPEMRGLAIRVLSRLGPKAADAVGPLADAIGGASPEVRTDIHLALAAIGPGAAPATSALAQGLSAADERVRQSSLYALRMIGPDARAAVEPVLQLLAVDDSATALAAAWTLASIAPGDSRVGAKAVPVLIRGLSSDDENVRLESADALSAWGPAAKQAAPTLASMAKEDGSEFVRAAAEAALAQIEN
jgi:HEAT repeat protein